MSYREHKRLAIVGIILMGLSVLSFALRAVYMVATGHASETYSSAKGAQLTYGGACITLLVMGVAIVVAVVLRQWARYRGD